MTHYDSVAQFSSALRLAATEMKFDPRFQNYHIALQQQKLTIHPPVAGLFPPGLGRAEIKVAVAYRHDSNGVDVVIDAQGTLRDIVLVLTFLNAHLEGVPV